MNETNEPAGGQPVIITAGLLVIGDEILSGRTKDKNIGHIAEYLTGFGIDLKEVRVVADETDDIVAAVDALRHRYTYVFTTGGIGPTHDDITADSVAKAFGVTIDHHPDVVAKMRAHYDKTGLELNEARLRMARIPDGATLIENRISIAPGFQIGNVFVLAGVPAIMHTMLDAAAGTLKTGTQILSQSIEAEMGEGDVAKPLGEIQEKFPDVMIGSYPYFDGNRFTTQLVLRSRDADQLQRAVAATREALDAIHANKDANS